MRKKIDNYLEILQEMDPITTGLVLGGSIALVFNGLLYLWYKTLKNEEAEKIKRACGKFSGKEKKICVYKVKIEMMKKYRAKLPSYKAKCKKRADSAKCLRFLTKTEAKVNKRIAQFEAKLKKIKEK